MKVSVQVVEQAISSERCKFCGRQHSVKFEGGNDPVNPAFAYSFSNDACEEFKNAVKAFVAKKFADAGFPVTIL
ncbi:MAG: hypothetical protein IKW83_00320 [Muribaculaceae bacterium]|nr:hypothetical protein [Muribaculaceae bacterium]